MMAPVGHDAAGYSNNQAEVSHQPTRRRERQVRGFKSPGQIQRFPSVHGFIQSCFRLGRHLLRPEHFRVLRSRSFEAWSMECGYGYVGNSRDGDDEEAA